MGLVTDADPNTTAKRFYVAEIAIIVTAGLVALLGMRHIAVGETVNSRLATVWGLAHDGAWYIDRPADGPPNPFERTTIDKVAVGDRRISSKPPILPLIMTGEYLLLHAVFGWELEDETGLRLILECMILSLMISSYVCILIFFAQTLHLFMRNPWPRLFALCALAFGTQLPGFAGQINNHVPSAAMLMIALYLALGLGSGKLAPRAWRFGLFGLTAALVFVLDIPSTIFVALAGLYLAFRFPRQTLVWAGLGAVGPLALHFGIMIAVTGSPWPVQIKRDMFLYEGSYWRNPGGIDALNEPKLTYLFHLSFGRYGTFALFPILLAGLAGAARAVLRKDTPWRGYVLGGALAFGILTAYYVARSNNYGGAAYGFRWHMAAMPVLLLMAIPVFENMRARWRWVFAVLLLLISMYSAWECLQTPWGANQEWTCRLIFGPSF